MDQFIGRPPEAVDECCSTASISMAKSEDLAKQSSLRGLNMASSKQICEVHHNTHKKSRKKKSKTYYVRMNHVSRDNGTKKVKSLMRGSLRWS